MRACRQGRTVCVVAYDSEQRTGHAKAYFLESATAWVKYANVVKHYGVKYWEIGNENWQNGTATPEEMAKIVVEFSRAMKAVDPTIQIGSNGMKDDWWAKFLPVAATALDFISLSHYNTWAWGSYKKFTEHPTPDLMGTVTEHSRASRSMHLKPIENACVSLSPKRIPGILHKRVGRSTTTSVTRS